MAEGQIMLQPVGSTSSDDDDKKDSPSQPTEKKAGRRKINIEFIEDKSRRHITFSKRKAGIMKKAYELSTLTGTQVLLLVASETGHVYTFATPKLQPLITKPEGKNLIQTCLNAPDPPSQQQQQAQAQQPQQAPATPHQQRMQNFPEPVLSYAQEALEYDDDKKDQKVYQALNDMNNYPGSYAPNLMSASPSPGGMYPMAAMNMAARNYLPQYSQYAQGPPTPTTGAPQPNQYSPTQYASSYPGIWQGAGKTQMLPSPQLASQSPPPSLSGMPLQQQKSQ